MRNLSVNWHEGMFLRPHYFQAAERFRSETLALNVEFLVPFAYGLHHLRISPEALQNGCLEFSGLQARWKDGTVISQDQVVRVDLNQRLDAVKSGNEPVSVYLALPLYNENQPIVGANGTAHHARYTELEISTADEVVGGKYQPISLRELNYSILFGHEDLNGFEIIPLARLKRSEPDGLYSIDENYFPPSLSLQAWPELAGIVRKIYDLVGSRIQSLKQMVTEQSITLTSQAQGDLDKMLLLHGLNEAYGELGCLTFAKENESGASRTVATRVHPFVAYTALCRIVGRCSIFGPELAIGPVPEYDHENLAKIFKWALDEIKRLIFAVTPQEFEQRNFIGAGPGMRVHIEPEWFGDEWDWHLGINPVDASREECMEMLRSRALDWVLGSAERVEYLLSIKRPGVKLGRSQNPPALPRRGDWLYFQIKKNEDDEEWVHVRKTQSLAMRISRTQIANLDSLEGNKRVLLRVKGRTYALEFAVFAVRKRI